jgi:hypothetical protein
MSLCINMLLANAHLSRQGGGSTGWVGLVVEPVERACTRVDGYTGIPRAQGTGPESRTAE